MSIDRCLFIARLVLQLNKRTIQQVRKLSKDSYFHNPGSEPLEYGTLGNVLERTAHEWPGRVAIRSVYEDRNITYEQLLTQVDSLGGFLRAQGFEKGDRLGIWSHNSASWIVTLLAAVRVGVIPVAINPVIVNEELNYCINKVGLKGLFIGSEIKSLKRNYYNQVDKLIPELWKSKPGLLKSTVFPTLTTVIADGQDKLSGTYSFNSIVSDRQYASKVSQYGAEVSPDDDCIIHFTSGTSGKPKAVLSSHLAVVNNSRTSGKGNFFHEEHHTMCVQVPIFHALGSFVTVLASYRFGATTVLAAPVYNVDSNLKALVNEKCTVITGTPTMFVDLVYMIKNKGVPAPKLRVALTAGSPCSPHLIKNMKEWLRADFVQSVYGMTESTGGMFQTTDKDTEQQVAETVGQVSDYFEVKRAEEERLQLESIEWQITQTVELAAEQEQAIQAEIDQLRLSRDRHSIGASLLKVLVDRDEEELKQEILRELESQNLIAELNKEMLDLQTKIQERRADNEKWMAKDPLVPLIEEEKRLRQLIFEMEREWGIQ